MKLLSPHSEHKPQSIILLLHNNGLIMSSCILSAIPCVCASHAKAQAGSDYSMLLWLILIFWNCIVSIIYLFLQFRKIMLFYYKHLAKYLNFQGSFQTTFWPMVISNFHTMKILVWTKSSAGWLYQKEDTEDITNQW